MQPLIETHSPLGGVLHGQIRLVADDVVDVQDAPGRQLGQEIVLRQNVQLRFSDTCHARTVVFISRSTNLLPGLLVAGEEDPLVVLPLDEGVGGVAVGLHHGEAAHPVVVGLLPDIAHNLTRAFNLTALG